MSPTAASPACAAAVGPGQAYCNSCGTPLPGYRPVTSPVPLAQATQSTSPANGVPAVSPSLAGPRTAVGGLDMPFVATTLVLAVAVFARFFRVGETPSGLLAAEDTFRRAATAVLDQGWIGLWSQVTDGQPTAFAYLVAGWTGVFGESATALRLLPAALGVLTLAVFFVFCRGLLGRPAAVFGTAMLAFSLWHFGFSRLSVPAAAFLMIEVVAAHLVLQAMEIGHAPRTRRRLLVAGGVAVGAGLYVHNAFILFAVAVALLWVREFLSGEHSTSELVARLRVFLAVVAVVALPLIVSTAANRSQVFEGVRGASISRASGYREAAGVTERSRYVIANVARTAWGLLRPGGGEGVGRLLDPVTGLLAGVGLVLGLSGWRDRRHLFLLAMFAVGVVAAGVTTEGGSYARLMVAAPAIFAYAGLALHWLPTWLHGRAPATIQNGLVAAVVLFVVLYNLVSYYSDPLAPDPLLWARTFGMAVQTVSLQGVPAV